MHGLEDHLAEQPAQDLRGRRRAALQQLLELRNLLGHPRLGRNRKLANVAAAKRFDLDTQPRDPPRRR